MKIINSKFISIFASLLIGAAQNISQAQLAFAAQNGGVPSIANATLETFDEPSPSILTLAGGAFLTTGAGFAGGGLYFPPYFSGPTASYFGESPDNGLDVSQYVVVPEGGVATLTFPTPQSYFGVLIGSVDVGNTITFFDGGGNVIGMITGGQISQDFGDTGPNNTFYLNVTSTVPFLSVSLTFPTGSCFEFDDVAYSASLSPYATATAVTNYGSVVGVTNLYGGYGYTNVPVVSIVGGGGTGATAVAVVSNGVVTAINITDEGSGYTNLPLIIIGPPYGPPFGSNSVLQISPMSLLTFSNLTLGSTYQLQAPMAWYWTNLPESFTATNTSYSQIVASGQGAGYRLALGPAPSQAFATPQIINGFLVGAAVTVGGSGYATVPLVSIVGGGGTNATAFAQVSGGVVTGITITDAGTGYIAPPSIQISPPPAVSVSPSVSQAVGLNSVNLIPYGAYQIQFTPALNEPWQNWYGGLFVPTSATNSQFLSVPNGSGFFRLAQAQ